MSEDKFFTRRKLWIVSLISSFSILIVSFQNCSAVRSANSDSVSVSLSESDVLGKEAMEILSAKCLTCHNPEKPEGGISDITDLSYLLYYRLVIPGQPEISDVIRVIKEGTMPPSGSVSTTDLQALNRWILEGLIDSSGNVTIPGGSSQLEPTYSSIKVRIINTKCLRCHSGGNPSGNVDMTTFAGMGPVVAAGNPNGSRLIQAVERTGGDFMPRDGARLNASEIAAMRQWIASGAKQ